MGEWSGEEVGFREDSCVQTTELTPHNESTGGWETRSGKSRNQGGCGILGFRKREAEELVLNKSRWERTWLLMPRLFLPLLKSTFEWPHDPHGNCSRLRILTSQL